MGDFWVFGYGSLMWRPGFVHEAAVRARVSGFRRALCVRSRWHRGTPEREGLVLGLDRGGACVGVAFRVANDEREGVVAYLRERELVTNVYLERTVPVRLATGESVSALTYVVDRTHPQYAGRLDPAEAAATVRGAVGHSGANPDYVLSAVAHLAALGIRDRWLEEVADRLNRAPEARPGA